MTNPFLEHADRAIPSSVQRKENRAQARALAKVQAEKDKLTAAYQASWAQHRQRIIETSPHRRVFTNFLEMIENATEADGQMLVDIGTAARQMRMPIAQRQFLLSCIAQRCCQIRKDMGLPWFDDPIPFPDDTASNVFLDAKREIDL